MHSSLSPQLRYEVRVADAAAHLIEVTLTLEAPAGELLPEAVELYMPVWAPGSYLVREYARHLEGLAARSQNGVCKTEKVRKNAWRIATASASSLTVSYLLYANDLTVRTNHVDEGHAYWNGPATYLVPSHLAPDTLACEVHVHVPETWQVATGLAPLSAADGSEAQRPTGQARTFVARSLDELMDCPFECGQMIPRVFELHGKAHEVWVWGNRHAAVVSWEQLVEDTRIIVETEAKLLAGEGPAAQALPYERYAFLWHVVHRGRGGLEHENSTSLQVSSSSFATRGGYLDVLGLVAHEFLHLWNVKRIRPAGLTPYRYEEENYTRQLWWFEGGTSYFDWRVLRLSGLCTPREYTEHLAGEFARLADTPGALVHSLEAASFDAWIKAYRPDENSLNSTVSYYLKGEVVCALMDIEIRSRSAGRRSLDDVLRTLWRSYGEVGKAVPEGALCDVFSEVAGVSLEDLFASWVRSTDRIDPAPVLAKVGLAHERKTFHRNALSSLGVRGRVRSGRFMIDALVRGGAAMRAGLDVHDEIVAVAGKRVDENLGDAVLGIAAGVEVDVLVARDGVMRSHKVRLDPPTLTDGRLVLREDATPEQLALLEAWLGQGTLISLQGQG